jgi:hypothetical protein
MGLKWLPYLFLSVIDYLVLDTIKRTSCQYLNLVRIKGMRRISKPGDIESAVNDELRYADYTGRRIRSPHIP